MLKKLFTKKTATAKDTLVSEYRKGGIFYRHTLERQPDGNYTLVSVERFRCREF